MGLTHFDRRLFGYLAIGAKAAVLFTGAAFGSFIWNAMTAPSSIRADDKPDPKGEERARLKKASMGDIVCRSFRVIDADGNARAYMGVDQEGDVHFGMYSPQGLAGLKAVVTNDGGDLEVRGPGDEFSPAVGLYASLADDESSVSLQSNKERNVIIIATSAKQSSATLTSRGGTDGGLSTWVKMSTSGTQSNICVLPLVPNDKKVTALPNGSLNLGFKKDEPMGLTLTGDKPVFWPPR